MNQTAQNALYFWRMHEEILEDPETIGPWAEGAFQKAL